MAATVDHAVKTDAIHATLAALRPALGRRVAAGLVDLVVLTPPTLALLHGIGGGWAFTPAAVLAVAAFDLVWRAGFEASPWQATPGKRLAGLRVADRAGRRLGPARAAWRTLPFWGGTLLILPGLLPGADLSVAGVSIWTVLAWAAAPLCMVWARSPGGRALHDRLAGAVVGLPAPAPGVGGPGPRAGPGGAAKS